MTFTDKLVLVTGGGSGIGLATSLAFARLGAIVAVVDRNAADGERAVQAITDEGHRARLFVADVANAVQIADTISQLTASIGAIDVVVSNAGIQRYGTVTATDEAVWDEVMATNLKGAFLVCKYA